MNQKPLFSLTEVSTPPGLLKRVLLAIEHKQRMARLWRIRISVAISAVSLAALIPASTALANSFALSHFTSYLSLLTDSAALTYWKEISVSILESVPAATLTMTVALVGVLLWSMRMAIRSISTNTIQLQHA